MASTIPFLFSLQDIDLEMDGHRAELEAAHAALADTEARDAAEANLAEAEVLMESLRKAQKDAEFVVEESKAQVEPLEAKLYDGSIKSPKELQELDHQVTTLKSMLAEREAELLDRLTALESQAAMVEAARADLDAARQEFAARSERLTGEIAVHQERLSALEGKRAEAAKLVDPAVLRLYDQLRPRVGGGRALARVERGMCMGCRISLPVNVVSRSRSGATVQCTSCQRIIFAS